MERQVVQTVNMRMSAVIEGDIVNRNPEDGRGWFVVDSITDLGEGKLALADAGSQNTATGKSIEVITVQIVSMVDFDALAAAGQASAPASQTPAAPASSSGQPADATPADDIPRTSLFAGREG